MPRPFPYPRRPSRHGVKQAKNKNEYNQLFYFIYLNIPQKAKIKMMMTLTSQDTKQLKAVCDASMCKIANARLLHDTRFHIHKGQVQAGSCSAANAVKVGRGAIKQIKIGSAQDNSFNRNPHRRVQQFCCKKVS